MSEEMKNVARRFYEEVNAGNLDRAVDDFLAEDFVEHEDVPERGDDRESVKQFFAACRTAFPDVRFEPQDIIAEGDLLCVRFMMSGTHEADFIGLPPTGRRMEVEGFDMVRMRDGKAVEHWGTTDAIRMLKQLGIMPDEHAEEKAPA
jgi:steroid delta-isomerase-like uncharacterized protein